MISLNNFIEVLTGPFSLRGGGSGYLQWTSIGPAGLAMVLSGVEAQIDAIERSRS